MPPELLAAIEAIQSLPGIGRRSAMRIAFDFIRQGKSRVKNFSDVLTRLVECIAACDRCGAYRSATESCPYCDNSRRNPEILCVVEHPSDIYAVENTGEFFGIYHALGGVLSPLDGIGPEGDHLHSAREYCRVATLAPRAANVALFLISDEASWVTGAAIPVDGASIA